MTTEELIEQAMTRYERARLAGIHVDDAGNEPDRSTFRAVADCASLVPELLAVIGRYEKQRRFVYEISHGNLHKFAREQQTATETILIIAPVIDKLKERP